MSEILFNSADLFPLLPEGIYSYQDEQRHSEQVDAFLGLQTEQVECVIRERLNSNAGDRSRQYWVGLPVKTLLTPYTEIRTILKLLEFSAGQHIVDLGAGYGRMAFVVGEHYDASFFTGFEAVSERVHEGQRSLAAFSYPNCQLLEQDLAAADFIIPVADIYFIYDFGSREAISSSINQLQNIAKQAPVKVAGRGRATRDCIEREHPWLSQVHPARHFKNFSIYSA